ncbi:MAG: hypothetical protein CO119_02885 [Flavobacteriales bacterium CG_4_9_14_3_um_filter_40_17]|nr:MAG: hypothetical protein CO119_02885 [Flavobacteriales bacterium CG_4_9_14_3_um_filter_40_17]
MNYVTPRISFFFGAFSRFPLQAFLRAAFFRLATSTARPKRSFLRSLFLAGKKTAHCKRLSATIGAKKFTYIAHNQLNPLAILTSQRCKRKLIFSMNAIFNTPNYCNTILYICDAKI